MSEIYTLTSSHLYGIIYRILPDDRIASSVLKKVYERLWERRHEIAKQNLRPLTYLRLLAHRYAMDYKFANNIASVLKQKSPIIANTAEDNLKPLNIKPSDLRLLKRAYLEGLSCEDLAELEGIEVDGVKMRLASLANKLNQEVL